MLWAPLSDWRLACIILLEGFHPTCREFQTFQLVKATALRRLS